jgi:hypothetical protein
MAVQDRAKTLIDTILAMMATHADYALSNLASVFYRLLLGTLILGNSSGSLRYATLWAANVDFDGLPMSGSLSKSDSVIGTIRHPISRKYCCILNIVNFKAKIR